MKIKRQKTAYKILNFYKNTYGINSPYKVLIDGTFCKACLSDKVNIMEQLPKYLDSDMTLMTTTCVIAECKAMGSLLFGPLKVLSQYKIRPCSHKEPVPAAQCLSSLVMPDNKKKYFIATQDQELTKKCRDVKGVPLLYLAFKNIILEKPSNTSMDIGSSNNSVINQDDLELKNIKNLKRRILGEEPVPDEEKKKMKFLKKKMYNRRKRHQAKMSKSNNSVKKRKA